MQPVAPVLKDSVPAVNPVAVLVSQASFRVQWLLDRKPGGAACAERSAGHEYEDNPSRASRRETLQRLRGLGIEPHLLTSVTPGGLAGVRVLILPDAIALSDDEMATLRDFTGTGGKVFADTAPGLFDGHGKLRPSAPAGLAEIPETMQRAGTAPSQATLDGEAGALASAGVTPRAVFRAANGGRAPGIEARWFDHGDQRLLSIQPIAP